MRPSRARASEGGTFRWAHRSRSAPARPAASRNRTIGVSRRVSASGPASSSSDPQATYQAGVIQAPSIEEPRYQNARRDARSPAWPEDGGWRFPRTLDARSAGECAEHLTVTPEEGRSAPRATGVTGISTPPREAPGTH